MAILLDDVEEVRYMSDACVTRAFLIPFLLEVNETCSRGNSIARLTIERRSCGRLFSSNILHQFCSYTVRMHPCAIPNAVTGRILVGYQMAPKSSSIFIRLRTG